jgi:NitT/TauT family transport system ATP-binding protein
MITFENVSLQLGGKEILRNVSFHIEPEEMAVLTGISGSGKTTLLRLIAGILKPDSGNVRVQSSKIGFVFQDHRLLPWKTAVENITLVLKAKGLSPEEARRKALSWLDMVGLARYAGYYPAQLSGGMVQRVSIARAFAVEPDVVLMDEPFSSLDDRMTDSLLLMIQKVLAEYKATVLYVTHDVMEALRLADRLLNLENHELTETPVVNRQELLQTYCNARLEAITPNPPGEAL